MPLQTQTTAEKMNNFYDTTLQVICKNMLSSKFVKRLKKSVLYKRYRNSLDFCLSKV